MSPCFRKRPGGSSFEPNLLRYKVGSGVGNVLPGLLDKGEGFTSELEDRG